MNENSQPTTGELLQAIVALHTFTEAGLQRLDSKVYRLEVKLDEKIDNKIDGLRFDMNKRFAQVYRKFDDTDVRFDHVYRKFDEINGRFDHVYGELDGINKRFDHVYGELDEIKSRVTRVEPRPA